jgi:hypothetical protein
MSPLLSCSARRDVDPQVHVNVAVARQAPAGVRIRQNHGDAGIAPTLGQNLGRVQPLLLGGADLAVCPGFGDALAAGYDQVAGGGVHRQLLAAGQVQRDVQVFLIFAVPRLRAAGRQDCE